MHKERRQQAILSLIEQDSISNQERLRLKLHHLGFKVTQATLSRDLKELNVVKTATDRGTYKYTALDVWKGLPIRRCDSSGNLLVFRTDTGMAPALAYKIDDLDLPSVIGTVAGEDTLLVVVAEGYDARKVRKKLWQRLQTI
ncbi:MAG: arginine repressor [Acidobacteriota bacterium]